MKFKINDKIIFNGNSLLLYAVSGKIFNRQNLNTVYEIVKNDILQIVKIYKYSSYDIYDEKRNIVFPCLDLHLLNGFSKIRNNIDCSKLWKEINA